MDNNEKKTLVEEGTEFSGKLKAKCRVVVKGEVDGELVAPSVDVADTGSVTGILKAETVTSHGAIKGTIEVDDITLAGKVHGDTTIRAKTLEVKPATQAGDLLVTFGDCVLEIGDMSADQPQVDDKPAAEAQAEPPPAVMQADAPAAEATPETAAPPEAEAKPEGTSEAASEAASEATASPAEGEGGQSGDGNRRRKRRRKNNKARADASAEADANAAPESSGEPGEGDRPQA